MSMWFFLKDVWVFFSGLGMAFMIMFTVLMWAFGMIDPAFLHPRYRTHESKRPALVLPHEHIPPQSLPTRD